MSRRISRGQEQLDLGTGRTRQAALAGAQRPLAYANVHGNVHGNNRSPDNDTTLRKSRDRSSDTVVLLLSIEQAAKALGLGRSKTYELIAAGELEVVHIGRCARVPVDAVEDYVERLRRQGQHEAVQTLVQRPASS